MPLRGDHTPAPAESSNGPSLKWMSRNKAAWPARDSSSVYPVKRLTCPIPIQGERTQHLGRDGHALIARLREQTFPISGAELIENSDCIRTTCGSAIAFCLFEAGD